MRRRPESAGWLARGLLLLFMGWYVSPRWLNGTWNLQSRVLIAFGLMVALICQFSLFATKRRYDFPQPPQPEMVRKRMNAVSPEFLKAFQMVPATKEVAESNNQGETKTSANESIGRGALDTIEDLWSNRKDDVLAYRSKNRDAIEQLKAALAVTDSRIDWPDEETSEFWSVLILDQINVLDWDAQRLLEEGRLEESLNCMVICSKFFPMLSPLTSTYVFERFVARMIKWAEHPDQTLEMMNKVYDYNGDGAFIFDDTNTRCTTPSAWHSFVRLNDFWMQERKQTENVIDRFLDFEVERRYRFLLQETSYTLPDNVWMNLKQLQPFVFRRDFPWLSYFLNARDVDLWEFADKERTIRDNLNFQAVEKCQYLNRVLLGYLESRLALQLMALKTGKFLELKKLEDIDGYNTTGLEDGYKVSGSSDDWEYSIPIVTADPSKIHLHRSIAKKRFIPANTPYYYLRFPNEKLANQGIRVGDLQGWFGLIDYQLRPNRPLDSNDEQVDHAADNLITTVNQRSESDVTKKDDE